jgi:hypothetical protein
LKKGTTFLPSFASKLNSFFDNLFFILCKKKPR